ncbi:Z1 domain-containing protein [Devosia salina]|uniref:Z1 domain-containing protein n=1 Tax=Devosia salina TaxID=2860336 RepID=A0ABX8WJW5_9HYPH|nr:Z1 domain-containing protein [Devosia salina]QYO76565.1 Z1 domain-containing protein [Devosia salina]
MGDTATEQKVIKFAQELIADEEKSSVTPAVINEIVDRVLMLNRSWSQLIDKEVVQAELIRRFSMWMGENTTLKNDTGHESWLNSQRKSQWRYWQRYREYQERKMATAVVDGLDEVTDQILSLLEDPLREGSWDRRGMVVGHVQSGKTSNYTGLICKAADAGYKIIIVLAGIHNNLRSQTQMRLDEGFLGYETHPDPEAIRIIGVGELDSDPAIRPNYVTNRSNGGDFNAAVANKLGISPEKRPWLFVVKKNKSVLEKLNKWVRNHVADYEDPATGRKVVTNLPLLLIDDEADHASVDTGADIVDEDGRANEDHEPKAINRLIRRLLVSFSKSAYVGYTATPFANIFIHERGETKEEGPDLFPASFIINLGAPSNYVGPARLFGRPGENGRTGAMPVVRHISDWSTNDDTDGWMPSKHKSGHVPTIDGRPELPESLKEAILSFVLVCAIRHKRGQGSEHSSMLVHVTRFTAVQGHVFDQVETYLKAQRQRIVRGIDDSSVLDALKSIYERDFRPTTEGIRRGQPDLEVASLPEWGELHAVLPDAVADIEVRKINGTAKDVLDYADTKGPGLKVIAVGGDKLSRGLTLEGLCVSYFLRSSKMYDTLMQMGRWFGYRPGYIDLCRLYCTKELSEWFGHIADASEELREEFELMAASGGTPRDFGLKVQSHPVLMVTSRMKMRAAKTLMLSFSGQLLETVSFSTDPSRIERNYEAARHLVAGLGSDARAAGITRNRAGRDQTWKGRIWEDVDHGRVLEFLRSYTTSDSALKARSNLIADYVDSLAREGELRKWTVAVIGGASDKTLEFLPGVALVTRVKDPAAADATDYRIGRLLSPRDESLDLDEEQWSRALTVTRSAWQKDPGRRTSEPEEPNGPAVRYVRGTTLGGDGPRGLLLIYPLDPAGSQHAKLQQTDVPVIGIGVSFPTSELGTRVPYSVNNVAWEQQYGSAE